jgi:hypothetical protein
VTKFPDLAVCSSKACDELAFFNFKVFNFLEPHGQCEGLGQNVTDIAPISDACFKNGGSTEEVC